MHDLEKPGRAHAAPDAHRDHREPGLAPAPLNEDMPGLSRSRHAIGVTDRDRAAVHIQPFMRQPETVHAVKHLAGECFIQFPEVDLVDLESLAFEQPRYGEDRAYSHLVGLAAARRKA